jgi:hypothetical protein
MVSAVRDWKLVVIKIEKKGNVVRVSYQVALLI